MKRFGSARLAGVFSSLLFAAFVLAVLVVLPDWKPPIMV